MGINISKNNMQSIKTVNTASNDLNYEWDIIVPDSKPDIGEILKADAIPSITSKEIMQDRAMLNGTVKFNILYVSAENPNQVKNIETTQNFNYVMELDGLRQNMILNVWAGVNSVNTNVLNSRKINVSCNLNFLGNVLRENNIEFVSGVEGDDIEYLTKEISTYKTVSETENNVLIQEEIEVPMGKPSISEVLKIDFRINNKDLRAIPNKIVVKGDIILSTVYNSEIEGDLLQYMEHEIPFTEIFDSEGVNENSICDPDYYVKDIRYFLKENSEGENRIVGIELSLVVHNKVYENIKINAIVDAYSKKYDLEMEKSEYSFDEIINETENQMVMKEIADFRKIEDISKIINIDSVSDINAVNVGDNKIKVKGTIKTDILYNSQNSNMIVNTASCNIPFENTMECSGAVEGTICEVKSDILQMAYNIIGPNQLELRLTIQIKARLKKVYSDSIINNIIVGEESKVSGERPSIIIYFCEENEKLWDIAKKYKTTINDIIKANELTESEVSKGMKLLIP